MLTTYPSRWQTGKLLLHVLGSAPLAARRLHPTCSRICRLISCGPLVTYEIEFIIKND